MMRRYLLTLVLALAPLCGAEASAPVPGGSVFSYTTRDGLSHNNILDIFTDSHGFVWLCTWNGISRYDGYHFKNWCDNPDNPPVPHNRFVSVSEDLSGNLWFGTYDRQLYRFERKSECFENLENLVPELSGVSWHVGNVLYCRSSSSVWVNFTGLGLVCFSSPEGSSTSVAASFIGDPTIGPDVSLLTETDDGVVWAVCEGGSKIVSISDDFTVTLRETSSEPVIASAVCGDGIVFASHGFLLPRFSGRGNGEPLSIDGRISCLAFSQGGAELYVGTSENGVVVLDSGMNRSAGPRHTGPLPENITRMETDSSGLVWIVDSAPGVTRFRPSDRSYRRFRLELDTVDYFQDELCLIKERNGIVWIKMKQSGFGYYDSEKDDVVPFLDKLPAEHHLTNGVVAFEVDKDNVMWVSPYYERGLVKMTVEEEGHDALRPFPGHGGDFPESVRALCRDSRGCIWAGTKSGRLCCYGPDGRVLHCFSSADDGRPLGRIYSLSEDSSGHIWVGTKGNGLWRLNNDGGVFRFRHFRHSAEDRYSLSDDNVYSVSQDSSGRIWVATFGGGVNILDEKGRFLNGGNLLHGYPLLDGSRARFVLCDNEHRFFVATTEGLLVCDPSRPPEEMAFRMCRHSPQDTASLGGNDVIYLMKDSSSRIWVCTYGGGLGLVSGYSEEGMPQFRNYTVSDGLPDNMVLSSAEDSDGNVWVATEKGLVCINVTDGVFTDCTVLSPSSVSYNEAAAVASSQGKVFFGGGAGLFVYDSGDLPSSGYDYRLTFTDFETSGPDEALRVLGDGCYRLPYDYVSFRVEFASLNFRLQDQVNYMYMLDGYDGGWIDSRKVNSASYAKVPSGRYRFRVKAYVGNGQMAGSEISFVLRIAAPPWLSWYAWCVYALLFIGLAGIVFLVLSVVSRLRAEAKMEQRMSEVKARFFTDMSHELRTPLTLILGGLEDLRRRGVNDTPDKGGESLEMSYKNSVRMLSLVNQLLDARGEVRGGFELRVSEIDIVSLVQDVSKSFRELAEVHGIAFRMLIPPGRVLVWADRDRMESVLYNLLSNAFKFTPDSGSITVSVWSSDERVKVDVADTGIGLNRGQASRVFGRHVSFHEAVRNDVCGSGIGLSLCKEIIKLHHGEISVRSEPGHGSCFTFTLLRGNAHFRPEQIDFSDPVSGDGDAAPVLQEPPQGAPAVLIVDDNPEMRRFVSASLSSCYRLTGAVDGADALKKISSDPPDVVVTDIMMPGLDGIELLERIRGDFATSHIPVIMLTAKNSYEDRLSGIRYGADAYITKPFSIEYLKAGIDNLLKRRKSFYEYITASALEASAEAEVHDDEMMLTGRDRDFLNSLKCWLETNVADPEVGVGDLAAHLGLGRTTMYNKVKSLTGKSPIELIRENRMLKAESMLSSGELTVSEVAWRLGFSDPAYFSRCFKAQFNMSPTEYIHMRMSDK